MTNELSDLLLAAANDPMWAHHSEIPKSILTKAAEAIKDLVQERDRLKKESVMLGNLLAVIHRDGGQHVEKVGIEQACSDAETIVSGAIVQIEEFDALIKQATLAEREACAAVCEQWRNSLESNWERASAWAANSLAVHIRARSGR
jgi:hypothetical protein